MDKSQKGKRLLEMSPSNTDDDEPKNLPKIVKHEEIPKVLKDKNFQQQLISANSLAYLFENIKKLSLSESMERFNEHLNKTKLLKKIFATNTKLHGTFVSESGVFFLKFDVITIIDKNETSSCAHLYFRISDYLEKEIHKEINESNGCTMCSSKHDDDNTNVVVSEYYINTCEREEDNEERDMEVETEISGSSLTIEIALETLIDANNYINVEDKTMITLPTRVFEYMVDVLRNQVSLHNELNELKQVNERSKRNSNQTMNNNNNRQGTEHTSAEATTQPPMSSNTFKKNKAVPPIFVSLEKCDEHTLLKTINSAEINQNSMKLFPAANQRVRLQVNNIEDYDKVHNLLKEKRLDLHTHAVKERIKPVYIIKNLCKNFSLDEIKESIKEYNFEVDQITRFETNNHRANNIDSKMVKVTLPEMTDTKAFEKIRYLMHVRVYIESLKPALVLQCKRCQRINHSATYCTYPYRCVKCIDNHEPGQCKLNAPGNTYKPKCCNCGGEHAASSYDCKVLREAINNKTERKKQDNKKLFKNNNVQRSTSAPTNANTSFANIVKNNNKKSSRVDILNNLRNCMMAMQNTIELLLNDG